MRYDFDAADAIWGTTKPPPRQLHYRSGGKSGTRVRIPSTPLRRLRKLQNGSIAGWSFTLFITYTSADFVGQYGHIYCFRSRPLCQ